MKTLILFCNKDHGEQGIQYQGDQNRKALKKNRSEVEVTEQIIIAIKSSAGYRFSEDGYTITIESLDELLPDISRHLIVSAIVEMEGVEVTDSSTGAVLFPSGYFK
jgi:hypothetical protein